MNTDEANYRAFLSGDNSGFEALVLQYKDNLIYFIHRYIKDLNQAEDIAQDAFVEVYVHKDRYNFKTSFKTYLFTIGRNKAVDFIRKNKRQILVDDFSQNEHDYFDTGENGLDEKVIKDEASKMVQSGIKKLKPEYQAAITLIDFEEVSYKEAARILNKTLPQIKVLIYRARKALGKILEEEGYIFEK